MKKVLIITYYWYPSGGSGVQRWLKMSKYLPENGWLPVIYTAENAEYPVEDLSLEKDIVPEVKVIRRPIIEPYSLYKRFLGFKKDEKIKAGFIEEGEKKKGWKQNLSVWIRGNMFIPDARCMWVRPSVRFLKGYLKDNPVDAVISTGPPHSMHLIAMKLHDDLGVPWIADFRDPWTGIDFYNDLHLSARSDRKHHRLENEVLVKADRVVAVGRDLADSLSRLGARDVTVITNGYDFNENDIHDVRLSDDFTISHIGIIGSTRNAVTLWKALGELVAENEEFKKKLRLRLIGQVDNTVLLSISQNGLDGNLQHISYIPHDSVMKEQCSSQLLLLLVNDTPNAKGILTGKVFEYLAARRPVLAVGPEDGDTAALLRDTSAGIVIDFHNKEKMKTVIMDFFNKYLNNNLLCHDNSVDGYSRRNLTRNYAVLLNDLIKNKEKRI